MRRREFIAGFAGAGAWPVVARAQTTYPTRPVRIIVPFAVIARLVAQKLTEILGKRFFVENQVGAGGNLAMGNAARAAPDGYTILFVSSSYVVNPSGGSNKPNSLNRVLWNSLCAIAPFNGGLAAT